MRAVIVNEFGPIETAVLTQVPDPVPRENEVLVKVRASAVNFVDLLVIGGKYQFLPKLPFTPGKGPAGVVVAAGDAVVDLRVGDKVLAMAEYGGYSELVVVAQDQCYRLPENMSFVDAASISLSYDTAWFALHERGRCKPGDVVLVLGASGAVGAATVQLAKAHGARVIAALSSMAKADQLLEQGAEAIVDLSMPDLRNSLREQVYRANNGRGADVVIDMLGGDVFDAALRAVAWRGRMVVVGFATGRIPSVKANYLLLKNIEVSGLQVSDYRKRMPKQVAECFAEIFSHYKAGNVMIPPSVTLPLDGFFEGLEMVRDRTAAGRVVLTQ